MSKFSLSSQIFQNTNRCSSQKAAFGSDRDRGGGDGGTRRGRQYPFGPTGRRVKMDGTHIFLTGCCLYSDIICSMPKVTKALFDEQ